MRKSILLSAIFVFGMVSVFAGPFGFSMGMTLDEITVACNGAEPKYIGDDRYYVQPAKSHPLFDGYVVWVSETSGLYYIKGISKEIKTTDYGTEVKQEFSKLLSPLERKYGKFKKTDKIEKDTLWHNEQYWMRAIANGARTYEATWIASSEDSIEKFDGLVTIAIGIKTRETYITDEAYIWIEYGFLNQVDAFAELDDVL